MSLDPAHVRWHRNLFDSLSQGGIWGVPRCAVTFKKEDGRMILVDRMPYTPEMSHAFSEGASVPPSPSDLLKHQQEDIDGITAHFRAAGIEVEDRTIGRQSQCISTKL